MIKVTSNSKIFIYAPSDVVTGGQECLHQLCDELNNQNKDAYIVYFPNNKSAIPNDYLKYNIKVANEVEDYGENILVLYEAIFNKIRDFKSIQKVFWWLSVDHFYTCSKEYLTIKDYLFNYPSLIPSVVKMRTANLIKHNQNYFKNNFSIADFASMSEIFHCYQSMYANNFLLNKGFKETYPLYDYINEEFLVNPSFENKKDIILYNPKKGFKYTQALIKASPELTWIPLINMNRAEVLSNLRSGKLYVDFGYHPGKDKIPREAAISGCCIITGRQGSANYYEDVPIPIAYKMDENNFNPASIIAKIKSIFNDYDNHISNFGVYHKTILASKTEFRKQIASIFN